MSSILGHQTASNTEQELMQEILQLMDHHTYTSLMELSGTESSERAYGLEYNTYAGPMDSSTTACSEMGYSSENLNNYTGFLDRSVPDRSMGEYGSYSNGTECSEGGYGSESLHNFTGHLDSSITGHSTGEYGSYSSGTECSEIKYSSENLHNQIGLLDSSISGSFAGEYGSYNTVTAPHVPDTSRLSPQAPINSGYMYDNHCNNDSGYSNQGSYSDGNTIYETKYLDISNYGPEQNNIIISKCDTTTQDMFGIYSSNTENHTSHEIYDHSSDLNTCDNDQTWDILDDVEFKHFIPDQEMSNLSSGIDQLQLDTSLDKAKPVRGKTRTKKQPKDVNVSMDAMNVINKMIPGSGKRARCPKNWEFLMRLLANPETNPSVICWEDRENYVFRLVEPEKIVELWNERTHKCSQTYDNFARGLRYHYQKGILQPVPEKQLVYRCGPMAIQYFNNFGCS